MPIKPVEDFIRIEQVGENSKGLKIVKVIFFNSPVSIAELKEFKIHMNESWDALNKYLNKTVVENKDIDLNSIEISIAVMPANFCEAVEPKKWLKKMIVSKDRIVNEVEFDFIIDSSTCINLDPSATSDIYIFFYVEGGMLTNGREPIYKESR